jgi:hypothetical protein
MVLMRRRALMTLRSSTCLCSRQTSWSQVGLVVCCFDLKGQQSPAAKAAAAAAAGF